RRTGARGARSGRGPRDGRAHGPPPRPRARLPVGRPLLRRARSGLVAAQLLARPGVGEPHLALRARLRAPWRDRAGGGAARAGPPLRRGGRNARVHGSPDWARAGRPPLLVDGGADAAGPGRAGGEGTAAL